MGWLRLNMPFDKNGNLGLKMHFKFFYPATHEYIS